jgi:serine/threonine protein kinase
MLPTDPGDAAAQPRNRDVPPKTVVVRSNLQRGLLRPGEVLSDVFEVRGLLGEGGMGQVYEAWDLMLNRCVALKVPLPGKPVVIRDEARALAALHHPSIVGIYGIGRHDGIDYIVMERIYGESLQARLDRSRAAGKLLPLDETLDVLGRIAEGLAVVHDAGMAHRDVKPANVMLAAKNRAVLMDFGIFKAESAEATGALLNGSPLYMAPETIHGCVGWGDAHLVDCYALGVMAFELLCGTPPFIHENAWQVLQMHVDAPVPDPLARRPETPRRLALLVRQLLAKDPKARPHMSDVVWQLRQARAERRLNVLIAEDNPETAAILASLVRHSVADAEVKIASDGGTALDMLRHSVPDLFVVDLHLPGLDGLGVCAALHRMGIASRCSVIATSGHAQRREIDTLKRLGFPRFVQKGYELGVLLPALAEETHRRLVHG